MEALQDVLQDLFKPPTERAPVSPVIKTDTFRFTSPNHSEKVLVGLQKQRLGGQFLDITIQVGNVTVQAHRSVLSAFSPYFEALFGSNMADSGLSEIKLRDLNGNAFKDIVGFAYTGILDISPRNVQDLLAVACFLCIDSVIDVCSTYLQSNLSAVNGFEILQIAKTYDRVQLYGAALELIMYHFEDAIKDESFFRIPVQLLLEILESDELIFTKNGFLVPPSSQEEQILEATLRYIDAEPDCRREHLPLLLERGVRLRLMMPEALTTAKSNPMIASSPDSVRLMEEALHLNVSDVEERQCWSKRRVITVSYDKAMVLANVGHLEHPETATTFDDSKRFPPNGIFYVTGMKLYIKRWIMGHATTPIIVVGGILIFYSNGDSILHGSDEYGREIHEFHLDPDERITSIAARHGGMIDQLTFTTNKARTFGPYGGRGGEEATLKSPGQGGYLAYISGFVDFITEPTAARETNAIVRLQFVWGYNSKTPPENRVKPTNKEVININTTINPQCAMS